MRKRRQNINGIILYVGFILTIVSCGHGDGVSEGNTGAIDVLIAEAEDSLLAGNNAFVLHAVRLGKETAKDSDDYYAVEELYSKYCFQMKDINAYLETSRRIDSYLSRNSSNKGKRYGYLAVRNALQKGAYYSKMVGDLDSAIVYDNRGLRLIDEYKCRTNDKVIALSNIADAYKQKGVYDQCISYYKWGLELADSIGTTFDTEVMLTMGIAAAYTSMEDFRQSEEWWTKVGRMYKDMGIYDKFLYLNNRGNDYYLRGKFTESRDHFERLDSLLGGKKDFGWERMFGRVNLSDVYIKLGETQKARALIAETEPFFRDHKLDVALFYLCTQKIEMCMKEGDIAGAARLAGDGGIPEDMQPEQKKMRLLALAKLYKNTGDMTEYAKAIKGYYAIRDSLQGNNIKMRFSDALMRYQRDARILQQQLTIKDKDLSIRYAMMQVAIMVVLLVLLSVVFVIYRRKRKINELSMLYQIAELRMGNIRNRISPHFIYNALSHEMLAQKTGREVNFDTLVSLLRYSNRMSSELCTTLKEEFDFVDYYTEVENHLMRGDIVYTKNIADSIDTSAVRVPSMSLQIFVENAFKHGLKDKSGGKLTIDVTRHGNGTLIEVCDNGGGTAESDIPSKGTPDHKDCGTGLQIVTRTVDYLNIRNSRKMEFGGESIASGGYRSWLYVPDGYKYELKCKLDL